MPGRLLSNFSNCHFPVSFFSKRPVSTHLTNNWSIYSSPEKLFYISWRQLSIKFSKSEAVTFDKISYQPFGGAPGVFQCAQICPVLCTTVSLTYTYPLRLELDFRRAAFQPPSQGMPRQWSPDRLSHVSIAFAAFKYILRASSSIREDNISKFVLAETSFRLKARFTAGRISISAQLIHPK